MSRFSWAERVGSADSRSAGHLDVITRLADRLDLCALCDADKRRLTEAGESYGVRALYTNLDAMLAAEAPEVVYRLTPTDSTTVRLRFNLVVDAEGSDRGWIIDQVAVTSSGGLPPSRTYLPIITK